MASTPKYVRLNDRLSQQVVADLDSGWSIAGLDVKEVPSMEGAPAHVRIIKRYVQQGILEPAGRAEFDEVQALLEMDHSETQEHVVQAEGEKARASLRKARLANPADGDDDEDDTASPAPVTAADGVPERLSPATSTTPPRGRGGRAN